MQDIPKFFISGENVLILKALDSMQKNTIAIKWFQMNLLKYLFVMIWVIQSTQKFIFRLLYKKIDEKLTSYRIKF